MKANNVQFHGSHYPFSREEATHREQYQIALNFEMLPHNRKPALLKISGGKEHFSETSLRQGYVK